MTKFLLSICVLSSLFACATTPNKPCQISKELTETIRTNIRNYIRNDFGESYAYYSEESAVSSNFYEEPNNTCSVLLSPRPGCLENANCLLHGEYFVYFSKESLEVVELKYIVY